MPRGYSTQKLIYNSCLETPNFMDELLKKIRLEQERQYMKMLVDVPKYEIKHDDIFDSMPYVLSGDYIRPFSIIKLDKDEKETNKMEAKKCDRCGKLYETENAKDMIRVLFKQEKISDADKERYSESRNNEMRMHDISIKRAASLGQVDFCPDCRESFKKWFEG